MAKKRAEKEKSGGFWHIVGSILWVIVKGIKFILTTFGLWLPILYALFGLLLFLIFKFNPFKFDTWGTLYLCGAIACVVGAAIISVKHVIVKPAKGIIEGYRNPFDGKRKNPGRNIESVLSEDGYEEEVVKNYVNERRWSPPEIPDFHEDKKNYGYFQTAEIVPETTAERRWAQTSLNRDWLPKIDDTGRQTPQMRSIPKEETPSVYFSKLEPDLLIHEYSDRYEMYRLTKDNVLKQEGVEYK